MSGHRLRPLRIAAATIAATTIAALVLSWIDPGHREVNSVVGLAWPVANLVVGLLLTVRRPRQPIGWVFAAIAFLVATGGFADVLAERGLTDDRTTWWGVASAWYGEWYWIPMITAPLIFLPLLFPDGRPATPRWRVVTRAITAAVGLFVVLAALQDQLDPMRGRSVSNPIGIPGLSDMEEGLLGGVFAVVGAISLLTAILAVTQRYRRSVGTERQQMKWFTFGVVTLIVAFITQGVLDAANVPRREIIDVLGFTVPPTTAAVAVFRYRLYAIDRIISRTVTYALVTALLIGVYAGAVTVVSAAVDPLGGESPVAVAVATLAAAALFRPAVRRIQRAVDRRFNRQRYDVQRTLDHYRERVRSDVDLDRLCKDLLAVTDETLQPRASLVWLRAEEATA